MPCPAKTVCMCRESPQQACQVIRESADGGVVYPGLFARAADSDAIASYLAEQGLLENQ